MILDRHWWRTPDGQLVPHEAAPSGSTLAYPARHDIPDHLAEKAGLKSAVQAWAQQHGNDDGEDAAAKQQPPPADKQAKQPAANKATKRQPRKAAG